MTVLSGQSIEKLCGLPVFMIMPFSKRKVQNGMSYGLSLASYDCRVDILAKESTCEQLILRPGDFTLLSTFELFDIPRWICAEIKDKSTWARRGLSCFNTFIEPGWKGYLTLEIKNQSNKRITLNHGDPICQIVFHLVNKSTTGYKGKYQNQGRGPVEARDE